ncbi:MAG: (2Fe-2S)-binding protein [Deltaproteobacteria bacterium]|nr:(2Fe-2S)-binding protein [Deltaproteobacteria bacterium]
MLISFELNSKKIEVETEPDRRVIDLLREDLGLTGVKESCGRGDCGSCSILVDGFVRLSCLMLAVQLHGRKILTIEGLNELEGVSISVQDAFVELGAVQCGFCTPGMIMSTIDLLNSNPKPSRNEIREAISGNICRCGAYQKILDAVETVTEELSESKNV